MLRGPADADPEVILIATGSEVALAVAAYEQLTADGVRARVVSMPSMELFDRQTPAYRDEVLPPVGQGPGGDRAGLVVRLGPLGRARRARSSRMSTFGASAPLKALQTKFGFTPEAVVSTARSVIAAGRPGG